ncbi:Probable beta-1,3-galactosyltransferase 2 [Linum perenne]
MSFKLRTEQQYSPRSSASVSQKWTIFLCLVCFCSGLLFTNRMWSVHEPKTGLTRTTAVEAEKLKLISEGCGSIISHQKVVRPDSKDITGEVHSSHNNAIQTIDKTISVLEMELAAAKAAQESLLTGSPQSEDAKKGSPPMRKKRKYLMVVGINTAFSSRKRRDSVRDTWMPQDFYVKVDDDVHVNLATLGETLVRHRKKPRVYIGCMKSGPVLNQKGVRYHEPEYWKFGEAGNKYFRHATGQLYAISHDLASYISLNQHVLHKFANEDVSLGSWFIGLDVDHIDDRRLCCGTPPDCEWKAQAGNACVASFDWSCSGICRSSDRIKEVHRRCGENPNAVWNSTFQD